MMISKYVITSFSVTLTSALRAVQGHEIMIFAGLYCLHLLISSLVMRRLPVPARNNQAASPRLQHWARHQHDPFTSF